MKPWLIERFLKPLALRLIPERGLFYLKARRYIREVGQFSEREEPDLTVVRHLVRRGDTVVDIGANVGWYTRYLSRLVGSTGHVFGLEPIPSTFALLSACVKHYGLSNVELFNVAASRTDGSAAMHVPDYPSGGKNYYMASIVEDGQVATGLSRQLVESRSLDSLLGGQFNKVGFIKCDVEGHELDVVQGAPQTIKSSKAAWLIEIDRRNDPDSSDSNAAKIFKGFEENGYTVWWFDGTYLRKRKTGEAALNYFFLLPEHLSQLSANARHLFA
ncbi:MAG: FkbM family methyltransferase [Nitrospira sp.]|nr:FkbM family methyltransferase [Nitrospira sp.]